MANSNVAFPKEHFLINLARKLTLFAASLGVALGLTYLFEPSLALTNGGSITALNVPLNEAFDTLSSTVGTGLAWADNSTIAGVYSSRTTYNVATGSSNTGALYSFGVAGAGPVGDRALGSVASGGSGTIYYGVKLTNNTGGAITSLAVQYTGEQWRNGGSSNASPNVVQAIEFQYKVASAGVQTAINTPSSGWIDHNDLDFASPIFGTTAFQTLDGNATANRMAKSSTITVNVPAGQEIWLRWVDIDNANNDHGLAVDDLVITADGVPGDQAPVVTPPTSPANGATNVAVASNIAITFSESVSAGESAFTLVCGTPRDFSLVGSPGTTLTIDPDADLPYSTTCTVTAKGVDQIADTDANDPPNFLVNDYVFSFTTAAPPPPGAGVVINEIDADTPGSDTSEFVELFDGGAGHTPLDGLVVVFFTGPDANTPAGEVDKSYAAFDLDTFSTDANGYFTLGNPGVPGVDLEFNPGPFGLLQNGGDAVAIYVGNASDFPFATPVTTANLQDAIVYGTDDPDAVNLLPLLNAGQEQVNEAAYGSQTTHSNQRCANGTGGARNTFTYRQAIPTPDGENNGCPPPPPAPGTSTVVISQVYGGGGNTGATLHNDFVELYNRGGAAVNITGWSLQYASSTGVSWQKQPLAGSVAPGEYYLIGLGAGTGGGDPLPPANVNGSINLSATTGKVALVDNFVALQGSCPKLSPHVKDLVGYGSANCREGSATAAGANNTTALLRKNGGLTDTDQNGSDFATISPPTPRQTAPIVEIGPYVLSTVPDFDDPIAPRDATIQVIFTEPVDVVDPWFSISCASTGVHDSFTQAGGGQFHHITPNINFLPGEQCTVTVFKDQVHDQDLADAGPFDDVMTADYSWTFTVATGDAPPYPPAVHLTMGNPSGADTGDPNNYLMEKPEFTLSYDRDLGRPNWVSWHLSDEWIGTLERDDTFRADPAVPPEWYRVQSFDFSGSGFDRGHMVPNADRDKLTAIPSNQATFLMTNMIAQAPGNNQGPWADLEDYLRTLLPPTNTSPAHELYIISGPAGVGGTGSVGFATTIAGGRVAVPSSTWKAALVIPKLAGDDVSRVTCEARTIAVIMPNDHSIGNDPNDPNDDEEADWETYLTSVDAIESLTGYDLFSNLPQAVQACIEAGVNGNNPPLDETPPSITLTSPLDGGVYQLNSVVNASFSCTDAGSSGLATCNGTVANGAAIDTASTGLKSFSVTATDVAGNVASVIVHYTVATNAISINNIPASAFLGNGFVPAFDYAGDGATSVTSSTPDKCTVSGGTVTFLTKGTCTLVAHAAATAAWDAAIGEPQSFVITKHTTTISIANIPATATDGGSFTPAFAYSGNGSTHVRSETNSVCKVNGGNVKFVGAGTCTLTAWASASGSYEPAEGLPQSFVVAPGQ